jgi:hypothetical protein
MIDGIIAKLEGLCLAPLSFCTLAIISKEEQMLEPSYAESALQCTQFDTIYCRRKHLFSIFVFCFTIKRSVPFTQYCAGGKIKENEMGWACGTYGGGERCAQDFGGEA